METCGYGSEETILFGVDMTNNLKTAKKIQTPTLNKILKVGEKSQCIGEFIEWLQTLENPIYLCHFEDSPDEYYPTSYSIEKLVSEFFKIDLNKAEEERRMLLERIKQSK